MELTEKLYYNVRHALETISKNEGFIEPKIHCYDQLGKGQGFLGDVFFVKISENKDMKKLDLVVKQATASEYVRKHFPIHVVYHNESQFYEKCWPEFVNFQKLHLNSLLFDNLATYYLSDVEPGKECLILENLNALKYQNLSKNQFFNREQTEFVLKKYGQFHGLSFAYKSKKCDNFKVLSQLFTPYWTTLSTIELFKCLMEKGVKTSLTYLKPSTDSEIIKKLENYAENVTSIFQNSTIYNGKYGVILQGDCWSNNILFKYNNSGEIEDIKLIDFQISNLGTVVNDLSYFLYSGGTKDIFSNIDHYLKMYHNSLSDTCSKFDCTNFISFKELKKEWKQYCKFGFLLGLMLIRNKLSEDKDQTEMSKELTETEFVDVGEQKEEIKKKSLELIYHMYENDFL